MSATILALATAVPPHVYLQEEIAQQSIALLEMNPKKAEWVKKIYQNSAIQKRHFIINDLRQACADREFLGPQYPQTIPGMSRRNQLYKQEAPKLAQEAAQQVIKQWGGEASRITHVISVSCTGMIAPGIEFHLMQTLGLSPTINRLGINFMGCFGAFKGLAVARAFALENPTHRILLVCTELCSLHMQADLDADTLTANSLFADGAAAALIGAHPQAGEMPLWEIKRTHSLGFPNSMEKMSWEASDRGFLMRLSHQVPALIGRQMKRFIEDLLKQEISLEQCDWAIHPGGKSIIQAVERALQLQPDQTKSSWETFAHYGNMSSATFLFVLAHLACQKNLRPWVIGVGFGPGLSAESLLLKHSLSKKS